MAKDLIGLDELRKSVTEHLKAVKEETEATEAATKATEAATKAAEEKAAADAKAAKLAKELSENMGLMGKVMADVSDEAESAAKSIPGMGKALDVLGAKLSKDTVKKVAIFAGTLGLAAASAKKWVDATQAALLAVPQLKAGQTNFADAMFSTAGNVLKSGLSIQELTTAMAANKAAFTQNTAGIVDAIGENRGFALMMGLTNEQLANMTARTSNMNNAMGNLTTQTQTYIMNLQEVAVQTGRQAFEIERDRATARQGTANQIAFLDKAGAAIVQTAITSIDNQFGPQMSAAVNGILGSGSTIHEMASNAGQNLRDLSLAAASEQSSKEALVLAGEAQIAILNRDADAQADVAERTAALSARIAEEGLSNQANLNSAGLSGVKAISERNKVVQENGKTEEESIRSLTAAHKAQEAVLKDYNKTIGESINKFARISSFMSNFGTEILAISAILLQFKPLIVGLFKGLWTVGKWLTRFIGKSLLRMAAVAAPIIVAFAAMAAFAFSVVNNWDQLVDAFFDLPFLFRSLVDDIWNGIKGLFGFSSDAEKDQAKSDEQENINIQKRLKRKGIPITQANIDAEKAGRSVAPSFRDELNKSAQRAAGAHEESKVRLFGGGDSGTITPAPAVSTPGGKQNAAKTTAALPAPPSAVPATQTAIETPNPALSHIGEQIKKAKSMEEQLMLMNESILIQTALLDVIAKNSGGSDITAALRKAGVSLASLQGNR